MWIDERGEASSENVSTGEERSWRCRPGSSRRTGVREISCDERRCRAGEVVGAEVGEVRVRIRVATCKGECSRRGIGCAEASGAGCMASARSAITTSSSKFDVSRVSTRKR